MAAPNEHERPTPTETNQHASLQAPLATEVPPPTRPAPATDARQAESCTSGLLPLLAAAAAAGDEGQSLPALPAPIAASDDGHLSFQPRLTPSIAAAMAASLPASRAIRGARKPSLKSSGEETGSWQTWVRLL